MTTQTTVSNDFYDVIVIGARCAGSPTAMLLARQGYRVLLLEKATLPSDVPRGHMIQAPGVALLKEWGLLDRVVDSNCPPISSLTFDMGVLTLTGMPEGAVNFAPRHGTLDKILADAAVESGVELREGFLVQEILMDGEQVTGIRGYSADGIQVTKHAKIVVGADGLHSLVARAVQAPTYHTKASLGCAYFTYFTDLPVDSAFIYVRDAKLIVVFPTNDNRTCVAVQFPKAELQSFRSNITGNFMQIIEEGVPELAARVRNATQVERFLGATDIPNFFRKPYGPGWVLVGDAGYHKDPFAAQGISDAFFGAKLAAQAIADGLSEVKPLEDALAGYEQQRNEDALPKYELNWQLATLQPPSPELQQLLVALVHNQIETNRFFGTLVGTESIPEFLSPANIQRIIAQSRLESEEPIV